MIAIDEIVAARARIGPYIHRTPLISSRSLSEATGAQVFLKAENLQKTGAFKVRGAFNKILGMDARNVITASMGNHAQAVAYAAREAGKRARIVMPVTVSLVKEEATRDYGAEVVLHGSDLAQALDLALSEKDWSFIHPFDDEAVMAGQGTIGIEIGEDLPDVDAVFVPVGGGGLIAGIACAIKSVSPSTRVVGVVPASAQAAYRSFLEKRPVALPPQPTIADGVEVGKPGEKTLEAILRLVDEMIEVPEDTIALAILLLMERAKMVVEGAGALPLAALLSHGERFRGMKTVLVASGGNIDFTLIDRIVRKGLVTNGRIGVFEVVVDDLPGSLRDLTALIAAHRANILDVGHNRLGNTLPLGKTLVTFTVEVRSGADLTDLIGRIEAKGFRVRDSRKGGFGRFGHAVAVDDPSR